MTPPPDELNKAEPSSRVSQAQTPDAVLRAVVQTTRQPFAVLDAGMRVRFANQAFLNLFEVGTEQTLGHCLFELGNGQWDIPRLRDLLQKILPENEEVEDYRVEHEFPRIGRKVMLFNAQRLPADDAERILVALEDITEQESLQAELVARQEFAEKLIDSLREAVLVLTPQLRVHSANRPFFHLFQVNAEDTIGQHIYHLGNGHWDIPSLRRLLGEVLPQKSAFDDYLVEHDFEVIGWRRMSLNARRLDHLNLILLTIRDLTGEARSEHRVQDIEQRLQLAISAAELGAFEWDVQQDRARWLNARMYAIFGRDQDQEPLNRRQLLEILHPDDHPRFYQTLDGMDADAPEFHFEGRIRHGKDGSQRWISIKGRLAPGGFAQPRCVIGVVADLTERRKAEMALQRERDFANRLLDTAPMIVLLLDPSGRIQYVNAYFERFSGYRLHEIEGQDWFSNFLPRHDQPAVRGIFEQALSGEHTQGNVNPIIIRDGSERAVEWYDRCITDARGAVSAILAVGQDVTERKRAEAALRESEQRFRIMADGLALIVWVHDAQGRQQFVNRTFLEFFGVTEQEVGGDNWQVLMHPEDAEAYAEEFMRCNEQQRPFHAEVRVRDKDAQWRWIESWGEPRFDDNGVFLGMVGTSADVTERKAAEAELRQMQQELERRVAERSAELVEERNFKDAIFNTVTALIVIVDTNGVIRGFNRACERITGYAAEDVMGGFSLSQLIPAQELDAAWAVFERLRDGKGDPIRHENHWLTRRGERVLISWSNTVLRDHHGAIQYIIGTGVDVTDQRRAEEEARQHLEAASTLQRLQTAHELATLLAHELNQPLGAIANYAEAGLQQLNRGADAGPKLKRTLERIAQQSLRAGQTIRSLREFVNRGHVDAAPVDLNKVARDACMLINPRARRNSIRLSIRGDESLPQVMVAEVQVEQVLLNLLRNAIDAIIEDGAASGNVTVELTAADERVRVSVLDSGPGIDAEHARRLFAPLTGTKKEGLGVGLSISRSLIEAHHGRIWAEPHVPGGILHFELPVAL